MRDRVAVGQYTVQSLARTYSGPSSVCCQGRDSGTIVSRLDYEFSCTYVTKAYAMSISARLALSNGGVNGLTTSHRAVGKRQPMCTYGDSYTGLTSHNSHSPSSVS